MNPFEQLAQATAQAQRENELPDYLAERIYSILAQPDRYRGQAAAIADLAFQVGQYDTYAQTGYMGMGVNNAVLEGTIRRIKEQVGG